MLPVAPGGRIKNQWMNFNLKKKINGCKLIVTSIWFRMPDMKEPFNLGGE